VNDPPRAAIVFVKRPTTLPKRPVLKPYYERGTREDQNQDRAALDRLVGFDTAAAKARGWAWLLDRGAYKKDKAGNLLRSETFDAASSDAPKAAALERAIDRIRSHESMYVPERIGAKRWYGALIELGTALDVFLPFAVVRDAEDAFFAGRTTGNSHRAVHNVTREVREAAQALASKVRLASEKITTYEDDPLPGLKATKPHLDFLATLEAGLHLAGFSYAEIAALVPDAGRLEDDRRRVGSANRNHADRIRKRVAKVKPSIESKIRRSALADTSLAAFMKRTRRSRLSVRDYAAWMDSPEGKGIEAQMAAIQPRRKARVAEAKISADLSGK
jgi:hypothetical protein